MATGTTSRRPHAGVLLVGNHLSRSFGTCSVGGDLAVQLEKLGWAVTTTSEKRAKVLRLIDMLKTTYLSRSDYNAALVEVFSGKAFFWAEAVCWLLKLFGKPFVLTLHGGNLRAFAGRWPHRVSRLLRSAAAVTTPSRYLLAQMSPYRSDLRVIPNAIDVGHYSFRLRDRPEPRIVWLRAFHEIYNPTLAARVVAELSNGLPGAQLTMIGPDKGDGSLQRTRNLAKRLGVAERVSFPGGVPKDEVPAWLQRGDIFLNTTMFESFGVAVMEAAACGLCIVSTNVGELPLLWTNGDDALLVEPDDPKAMACAVRRVLTEPALAERLSRNARAKAEQFDWSLILPQWERLLTEVVQGRRQ